MGRGSGEFIRYLQVVYKRRYLYLGVALLIMGGVVGNAYLMPKQYQADSTVFIETNLINNLVKGLAVTPDMDEKIRVLKYAILSRDNLGKVLADIDAAPRTETELQQRVASLQKRTDIKVNGKDLFTVSIVASDPVFAQEYINTLVSKYVAESLSGKRSEAQAANQFLEGQLAQVKADLARAEDAILAFRRQEGVLPATDEKTVLENIAGYRQELENIELNENALKAKKHRLESQLQNVHRPVGGVAAQDDPRVVELENRLQQLQMTYTADYPEVVRLRRELAGLQQEAGQGAGRTAGRSASRPEGPVYRQLLQKIYDVDAEISALEGRRATIRGYVAQREAELQQAPQNGKELAVLIQERDSIKKIHEELLLRLNQSEVSTQMGILDQGTTFRVVDAALMPNVPVAPDMVRMILLAIVAGIGGALGVVLLVDSIDTRVQNLAEVRELGLPVLAVVPGILEPRQLARRKRQDLAVYFVSTVCFSGILGLLAYEMTRVY